MSMGVVLRLAGQRLGMKIVAAIIMSLGPGYSRLIQMIQDGAPVILVTWDSFRGLFYPIAVSLFLISFVLNWIVRREEPGNLMLGAACTCAVIGILISMCSPLSLGYILAGVTPIVVIYAMFYGYLPERADQRRMGS